MRLIMTQAQRNCPVLTGYLRHTGYVGDKGLSDDMKSKDHKALRRALVLSGAMAPMKLNDTKPENIQDGSQVYMGFGANYAMVVHTLFTPYLLDAILQTEQDALKIIKNEIEHRMGWL